MKPTGRPTSRRVLLLLAVAMTAVLALSACLPNPNDIPQQTDETVEAFIGDLAANATASGSLVPAQTAVLNAPATGRVVDVAVRPGQAVDAGAPLLTLDTADLELNRLSAELDVRQAEASLADLLAPPTAAELAASEAAVASAQAQLDDLVAGPTATELASLESSLRSAQSSLASANAELVRSQNSVTDADIRAAEAAVASAQLQLQSAQDANEELTNAATDQQLRSAQQTLASAQARLDDLRGGADTAAAQGGVSAAAARLESAQAEFDRQTAGPSASQLASAEATLADAQASLESLRGGPTQAQIDAAEASLAQAQVALADAEAALADATVRAPFAGVLAAVNVQPGEIASGRVAELVDLSSLEVVLQVDEIDVGSLSVGQPATITLESYPDVVIDAEVASISPAAVVNQSTGLVTYDVRLRLGETSLPLLAGMTVNADLVTAEKEGVLLVPNAAIQVNRNNGTYSAFLISGETVEEVPVTIGLRDANYTEILSGLSAGDQLSLSGGGSSNPLMEPFERMQQ
jgi:HlyD family secretion protein